MSCHKQTNQKPASVTLIKNEHLLFYNYHLLLFPYEPKAVSKTLLLYLLLPCSGGVKLE